MESFATLPYVDPEEFLFVDEMQCTCSSKIVILASHKGNDILYFGKCGIVCRTFNGTMKTIRGCMRDG